MPRLAKGGKWTYGWVQVGEGREISLPPQACEEYGLEPGCELAFVPGSSRSGGFGITTPALMQQSQDKSGMVMFAHYGNSMSDIPSNQEILDLIK